MMALSTRFDTRRCLFRVSLMYQDITGLKSHKPQNFYQMGTFKTKRKCRITFNTSSQVFDNHKKLQTGGDRRVLWRSLVDRLHSLPFDEDILIYRYGPCIRMELETRNRNPSYGIDTRVNVAYLVNGSSYRDETSGFCGTLAHYRTPLSEGSYL
jgi:hypothetical protein